MIFKFECCTCSESFNVYAENLVKKDALICPNCDNKLPDGVFQKLKTATNLLIEVNKNSSIQNDCFSNGNPNHFFYKIQQ